MNLGRWLIVFMAWVRGCKAPEGPSKRWNQKNRNGHKYNRGRKKR